MEPDGTMQSEVWRDLLAPAEFATRRALGRLDDAEVPAVLRRVVASSARRLPPPLAQRLRQELDASEWLRARALEAWPDAGPGDADPANEASVLYLARPEGWEERLGELASSVRAAADALRIERLELERQSLERAVAELDGRLRRCQADAATAVREAMLECEERADRISASNRALRRELVDKEWKVADLESEIEELAVQLSEADRRIAELRESSRRWRRPTGDDDATPRVFGRGSPIDVARALDQMATMLHAAPAVDRTEVPATTRPRLPVGVRPDTREAVDWLLRQELPMTVLVDGHNVAHDLASPPVPATRLRVIQGAERLRRLAESPLRVTVFWDSSAEPEQRRLSSVDVRYVPSADDAITEAAAATDGSVLVVTTDAELRRRTEAVGALTVWGTAFSDWLRR